MRQSGIIRICRDQAKNTCVDERTDKLCQECSVTKEARPAGTSDVKRRMIDILAGIGALALALRELGR